MDRDEELTLRLTNLIETLAEETGIDEPPLEAAASWTEAAVRTYFRSGGKELPVLKPPPPADVVTSGQPGGGRLVTTSFPTSVPQEIEIARMLSTPEAYRASAFAAGIPDRPRGLFPPEDPVLRQIAAEAGGFRPFQKQIIGLSGGFEPVSTSWILSDGIDMRCEQPPRTEEPSDMLLRRETRVRIPRWICTNSSMAQVLLSERRTDRRGLETCRGCALRRRGGDRGWLRHGRTRRFHRGTLSRRKQRPAPVFCGSRRVAGPHHARMFPPARLQTVFDECTAELVKCACAPTATTISFSADLKKTVPLYVSLRLDAWITEITSVRGRLLCQPGRAPPGDLCRH